MQVEQALVYHARNLVNNHFYIGFTTQGLPAREKDHRRDANRGAGFLLHAAMRKYGHENIVFELMADFDGDTELAKAYEVEAIAKYKPEYNISLGGDGGVSPSMARKISAANKGRPSFLKGKKFSPEALAKFRATKALNGKPAPWAGKKRSPETVAKMRAANLGKISPQRGKVYDDKIRARMAEAARRRPQREYSEAHKAVLRENIKLAHAATSRPVKCVEDGRVFASARDADRFYGFRLRSVSKVISGETKSTHGMHFVRHVSETK